MKKKLPLILFWIPRLLLLSISLFWFTFALLSGAAELGGGVKGIILNSPNALPWLILLALNYVTFKWPRTGGVLLTIISVLTVFAFDGLKQPLILLTISLPVLILGVWIGTTSSTVDHV